MTMQRDKLWENYGLALLIIAGVISSCACLVVCGYLFLASLFDGGSSCYEDMTEKLPPTYPASTLVSGEGGNDPVAGYLMREYVTNDSPSTIAEFYSEGICFYSNPRHFARCRFLSGTFIEYTILINEEGAGTRYQIIGSWNCRGLD